MYRHVLRAQAGFVLTSIRENDADVSKQIDTNTLNVSAQKKNKQNKKRTKYTFPYGTGRGAEKEDTY